MSDPAAATSSTSRRALSSKLISMENEDLHSYIQDMEKSLSLNKQVLFELISNKISNTDTGNIISQLIQEVLSMEESYLKKVKECEDNQAKALMDEQIASEYIRKEQELIAESNDKITDIIFQNDKRSKIISELSIRIRQLEEDSELYKKSRNMIVVPPNEDFIELHSRVEELKMILSYEARNLYALQTRKEKLIENAEILRKEVEKLKILMKNPMNRKFGIERLNSNLKNDMSMEIIKSAESDEEIEGEHVVPLAVSTLKNISQNLFELSLNRQHTLSFDIMALSYKENDEDDKVFLDIQEHIESMKFEIEKITEALVKISKENEMLLENNEKLAQCYLKTHEFIEIKEAKEPKAITRSKYSKSNSNVNEEVFKFIDTNQLSPR